MNTYQKLVENAKQRLASLQRKMSKNIGLTADEIQDRDDTEALLRELGEDI